MNLEEFCRRVHDLIEKKPEQASLIEEGRGLMKSLVSDPRWFPGFLEKLLFDREFLDSQKAAIWTNEVTLHRSADRALSVFAYIWEPGSVDAVHDHGSWGIIGGFANPFRERKFRRLDDGRREGYAELEETSLAVIEPGETTYVLPLDEGIHQMENESDAIAVSINAYGRNVRQGYIRFFNPRNKTVRKIFPPRTLKEVLALRALGAMGGAGAADLLQAFLRRPQPDFLKRECEDVLSTLHLKAEDSRK